MGVVVAGVVAVGVVVVGVVVVGVVAVGVVVVGVVVVGVVVVGVVVVVVLVPVAPPDEEATVVVTVPFGLVLTTLAELRLPAGSSEYCPVPVPPPQAVNIKETLVATQSDLARIVSLLHVNWFTKIISID
jgi:hypothetical protein